MREDNFKEYISKYRFRKAEKILKKKLNKMIQGMLATSSIGSTFIGSKKKQKNSKNNLFLLH